MQLRLPAVSRKQCRGPSGRGRARLRSEDSTSLFLSFGVPPGRPLLQGIEPSRLPNLSPLERRTTWGPWGPSSPGLVTRVFRWGVGHSKQSDISFPKTPWKEAGVGQCPGGESENQAAGGAWGQVGGVGTPGLQ